MGTQPVQYVAVLWVPALDYQAWVAESPAFVPVLRPLLLLPVLVAPSEVSVEAPPVLRSLLL